MTTLNGIGTGTSPVPSAGIPELSDYWNDDFAPLKHAGNAILRVLRMDESSPHGDLYRRVLSTASTNSASSSSSSSSYGDNIPNHNYFPGGKMKHSQSIPLPAFLQDQLLKAKMSTLMGLFPTAQLAWMTIDDTIYLWSYSSLASPHESTSGTEFLCFQVPTHQPIVSAGLARPKAGVFRDIVEWCLVVTTKEEAMLCALARKDHQGLTAVPTKFVIPSDWISFLSVASTDAGRIFLGGQDGSLYEFDYDYLVRENIYSSRDVDAKTRLDHFYDGNDERTPLHPSKDPEVSKTVVAKGKRMLERVLNPRSEPSRKCRKVNHSQSPITTFVPEIFSSVANAIFGKSTTTGGGPIIHIAVDEERQVLYTLSTRGWICALDMAEPPNIALAAVLNTTSTARQYLEAVSRGRMYAPSTGGVTEGHLAFPGGGEAAQAGVGGMEGARRILKLAEQSKHSGGDSSISLLAPVAIEVVPMRESTRITLVAISAGGMRYYLSSLNPNTLGAGPAPHKFGMPRRNQSIKPHSRMTLCHIRAPPSLAESDVAAPSHIPSQTQNQQVDAACYTLGTFFVAFNKPQLKSHVPRKGAGNLLVVASADSQARMHETTKDKQGISVAYVTPGGICESVSYPLASSEGNGPASTVLPGGRVWTLCAAAEQANKVLSLALRSKTPSDTELGFGVAPAYVPPSRRLGLANESTNSKELTTTRTTPSMSSLAVALMTNWLLSRPARYGIEVGQLATNGTGTTTFPSTYRISKRSGAMGFSLSAADSKTNAGTSATRSARLSPWLLSPEVVPLSPMALQYFERPSTTIFALNAGGLHRFECPSILKQLSTAILTAGANARSDSAVSKFFDAYGYQEGCALCILIAAKPSSSTELKDFAMRAALSRAYRPELIQSQHGSPEVQAASDPWVPSGYNFTSSALYDGLTLTIARLLRPVWHKPAVVVTEGRIVKELSSPAKVELLFEDDVLDQVRRPLVALQQVIGRVFAKAILTVPQSKTGPSSADQMEVDEDPSYLTRLLEYQRHHRYHSNRSVLRASEADELAQHVEERNIHSLYRLVARTSQLLSLLPLLRRAHFFPDLPEVDWGQLHGISIAQLILSREGQDRVEGVLSSLVTSASSQGNTRSTASADTKELADLLSQQCYHFFSPGSRYAYFGFRAANDALATIPEQVSRRLALTSEAVENLRRASRHWHSPTLITGRLLRSQDFLSYDKMAERALQCDSPLAKACELLVELKDIAAVVDICLLTASNFASGAQSVLDSSAWRNTVDTYSWEMGLYHRRQPALPAPTSSSSTAVGASVTANDAKNTCHALIFHHLTRLLDAPLASEQRQLGERMVSVCAASQNTEFIHKFYAHLLIKNHADVLLRINSPALETWLVQEQENIELLLRHYQVQEKNVEAGTVAWNRATNKDVDFELNGRIEYLVYAVDSFSRAVARGEGDLNDLKLSLKQAEEWLSIARLQGRVLQTIASTKYELSQEDIKPLQTQLLSANDLLNKFALPYDMFEYCLLLLHACNHSDPVHIERFWKSLMCEEIFPCSTRSQQSYHLLCGFAEGSLVDTPAISLLNGNDKVIGALFEDGIWMKGVEDVVVRLGSDILRGGENAAFPIDFVTCCLEEIRRAYAVAVGPLEGRKTLGWVHYILVSAGVGNLVAIKAYQQMVEEENHTSMGADPGRRLEQLQAEITMLEAFERSARFGDERQSKTARDEMSEVVSSGELLSVIQGCRAKLQSLPLDVMAEENRLLAVENEVMRHR